MVGGLSSTSTSTSTKDAIGFHRARAQSALAGGARARNRLAGERLAGERLAGERLTGDKRLTMDTATMAVNPSLLRGRRCSEQEPDAA